MLFDELHQRYGTPIARRVQVELTVAEFNQVDIEELAIFLESRAEEAHQQYQTHHDNPLTIEKPPVTRTAHSDELYRRWRDAEDLAYIITVADDVSATTRRAVGSK